MQSLSLAHNTTPEESAASPVLPWRTFYDYFAGEWEQGEHVTLIGHTGSGKTTLATMLLGLRQAVVAFGVKGRDDTMDKLVRAGYWRVKNWNGDVDNYVVLWPPIRGANHTEDQREVFADAIDAIYRSGGWCVFFDEVSYLSEILRLDKNLKFLLQQGRSSGISVVGATQRPAFIPLAFYQSATHLFLWRETDYRNLKRLGEITGVDARTVQSEVLRLPKHDFLYVNTRTGERYRSRAEV